MNGDPGLFREFVAALDANGVRYCLLAGYDRYPAAIVSDVDFMVVPADAPRVAPLLAEIAARNDARLVQCVRHETTAAWFVIAKEMSCSVSLIQPDLSTDYRRGGRLWLQAADIVARRHRHAAGFWIASAADAFIYYLIKKVDKGALSAAQVEELASRYGDDPWTARQLLQRHFPAHHAELIVRALLAHDHARLDAALETLRGSLHNRAPAEPALRRLRQCGAEQARVLGRVLRPTGLSIAFLGPDGCGKSSVIKRVQQELRDVFRQIDYQHLRPRPQARAASGSPAPVLDPHEKPPRGTLGSIAKLVHFWACYPVGGLLWTFPRRVSSTLVIFDRYYHDIQADPRRYRYGASLRWARLLERLVPQPDLMFVLDAPARIIQARKQEVPLSESARQREAYLDLARRVRGARVIDASRPLDDVVAEVITIILARLEARLAARLALPSRTAFEGG